MAFVKIKVNPELCIAASSCVGIAPKFFELDEENRAMIPAADGSLRAK